MKRLFAAAILSVVTVGGTTGSASAWCIDHLFHHCHHCCTKICCKQYNAFSPPCCEGVMPMWGNGGPYDPAGYGASFGGDCDGAGVKQLPSPGSLQTPPTGPMPTTTPAPSGTT